jgi:alpha-amylase
MLLSLVFHNHQPVGQLPWAYEDAWHDSYEPFLDVLEKHPRVKIALHYTGSLLEWLEAHRPQTLKRVRALVEKGQVEILGGGYYEPILAIWPRTDQEEQVARLSSTVERIFGQKPRGIWLAERVWEASLAPVLSDCGVDFTFVDSSVFEDAGLNEHQMLGTFQQCGAPLQLFPINRELRYHIPWNPVEQSIEYLKDLSRRAPNDAVVVFADDGEKFGAWPGTYDYIFGEGWLDSFFAALETNESWLQTVLPSEYSTQFATREELNLPPGSYPEMQEWSGGNWRNFFEKYPESRDIYREVLRASDAVHSAPEHPQFALALTHVLRAQANDALWHGVFGGLYLRHLRQALYSEAAKAQLLIDGSKPFARVMAQDEGEAIIETESQKIGVRTVGGHAFLWTSKNAQHNILSSLRRYRESYHTDVAQSDWYPRGALLDHFFGDSVTPESFASARYAEQGDFCSEPWDMHSVNSESQIKLQLHRDGFVWTRNASHQAIHAPLRLTKTLLLQAGSSSLQVEYSFCNTGTETFVTWWGTEWNVALSGVDLPERHYHADNHKQQLALDEFASFENVQNTIAADRWLQLWIEWQFPEPVSMWHVPISTISQKEGGAIEETPQSSAFVFHKRLHLEPGKEQIIKFNIEITSGS